jgi:hypothetical protein
MPDAGEHAAFVHDVRRGIGGAGSSGISQELERDLAIQADVASAVDLAKATAPDAVAYLQRAPPRADRRGPGTRGTARRAIAELSS